MKISLLQLDAEINPDVAQEFIDHRAGMGKRYALKTQGAFDRQMKIALKAYEVGMSPDELIEFTIDQNWQGINISYTRNRLNEMMKAEVKASKQITLKNGYTGDTKTKSRTIQEQLHDESWIN